MIVDPDFLDHWRTRMLVDALGGDELAPMYVIRIWAHCQQRRGDAFDMPAAGLKALCRASVDAETLERALVDAGFVARNGATLSIPKWSEKNASLIAAWSNGSKGGKPKSEPKQNPAVTQAEPTGNPEATQAEPIREEKKKDISKPTASHPAAAGFDEFWTAWPKNERKQDKASCQKHWKLHSLGTVQTLILDDVRAKRGTKKWQEGFIEAPLVYLRGKRWEDGAAEGAETQIAPPENPGLALAAETRRKMDEQAKHAVPPPASVLALADKFRKGVTTQ